MPENQPSSAESDARCSCGNRFDGDNFCMPSACQWEGLEDQRPSVENGTAYHKVAFDGGGFFCLYCAWSGTFAAEAFAHEGSDIPPGEQVEGGRG